MPSYYQQIQIQNPEQIADSIIYKLKKNNQQLHHNHIYNQKAHQSQYNDTICLHYLKQQIKSMQQQIYHLQAKVKSQQISKPFQQKLFWNKNPNIQKTDSISKFNQNLRKYEPNNQSHNHQWRSSSVNLHDGKAMKQILYKSENPYATVRRSPSRTLNYDEQYHKQQRKIAKTRTKSPEGRSKISSLIRIDKHKFYSR